MSENNSICELIVNHLAVFITYKNPETREQKLYHVYPHVYYLHKNGNTLLLCVESKTGEIKTFNANYVVEADPGPKIRFTPTAGLLPDQKFVQEMICSAYDYQY